MSEFFQMGGYAFYVWGSYGLTFIVLLLNLLIPLYREQTLLQTLARKIRRKNHDRHDT